MEAFINILVNLFICSIPEESFLELMILIILKRYDIITIQKKNIIKISFPILFTALVSNILRVFYIDLNIVFLFSILSIFITNLIILRFKDIKSFLIILFSTLSSFVILQVIEFLYIPAILYATNKSIEYFNSHVFLNFLLALPERIFESYIVVFAILKKYNFQKINLLKIIKESKLLIILSIIVFAFNAFLILLYGKYIIFEKILLNIYTLAQIGIIVSLTIIPITNIILFFAVIYTKESRDLYRKSLMRDELNALTLKLKNCDNNADREKINRIIDDIKKVV